MEELSRLSTEYLRVPYTTSVEVTQVELAFTAFPNGGQPDEWHTAELIDSTARLLVGPGTGIALTEGAWMVWAKITDHPEIPVERVDRLYVY